MSDLLLQATSLDKSYQSASKRIQVLQELDLEIPYGRTIAIMGASGVGKSTLLHLLGALDHPDRGEIIFEGQSLMQLTEDQLAAK